MYKIDEKGRTNKTKERINEETKNEEKTKKNGKQITQRKNKREN